MRFPLEYRFSTINLIPFRTITTYLINFHQYGFSTWFNNLFGNVLIFMPFGFLIPLIFHKINSYRRIFLCSVLASMGIEGLQFFLRVGSLDVDDIILNSVGGMLGYFGLGGIFFFSSYILKRGN